MSEIIDSQIQENVARVCDGRDPRYPGNYEKTGVRAVLKAASHVARCARQKDLPSSVVVSRLVIADGGFGTQTGTRIGPVECRAWVLAESSEGHIALLEREDGYVLVGKSDNVKNYGGTLAVPHQDVLRLDADNFHKRASKYRGPLGAVAIDAALVNFAVQHDLYKQPAWYNKV